MQRLNTIVSWVLLAIVVVAGIYLVASNQVLNIWFSLSPRQTAFYTSPSMSGNGDLYGPAEKTFEPYTFEPSIAPPGVFANDFGNDGTSSYLTPLLDQWLPFSLGMLAAGLLGLVLVMMRRWHKHTSAMREWRQ